MVFLIKKLYARLDQPKHDPLISLFIMDSALNDHFSEEWLTSAMKE